jgi:hypothetical protein
MTSRCGDPPDADPRSADQDASPPEPQADDASDERPDAEGDAAPDDRHAIDSSDEPGSPPDADPQAAPAPEPPAPDRSTPRSPRPNPDPFATAPLRAVPSSDRPGPDSRTGGEVDLAKPEPSPRPAGGRRDPAPLFGDGLDEPTSAIASDSRHPGWPTASIVADAPTEAIPMAAAAGGRHRAAADDDLVTEWRGPRKTSRMTMILVLALLVALGFFAGVLVGRSAAGHTPSADRPAATGTARPGTLR